MTDYPSWSDESGWYGNGGSGGGYGGDGGGYGYGAAPQQTAGTVYGNARPQFSEDGRGAPYSTLLNKVGPAAINKDISYDTSSRDPAMLRARVFLGNILKGPIVREDIIELFRSFGTILACTLLKGYAFIQFGSAAEADAACEELNGKRWKGVMIDVHLAMEGYGKKRKPPPPEENPTFKKRDEFGVGRGGMRGGIGGGRGGGGAFWGKGGLSGSSASSNHLPPSNAPHHNEERNELDVNRRNSEAAFLDFTTKGDMVENEMADTLICGTCRYITNDFVTFREHRKKPCSKPKDEMEPPVLRCASCGLRFLSAWTMLLHLTEFHRMQLFKPDYSQAAIDKAKLEAEKLKAAMASKAPPNVDDERIFQPRLESVKTEASDELQVIGGGRVSAGVAPPSLAAPAEKMSTGADYNEDEEDDDVVAIGTIPTLDC